MSLGMAFRRSPFAGVPSLHPRRPAGLSLAPSHALRTCHAGRAGARPGARPYRPHAKGRVETCLAGRAGARPLPPLHGDTFLPSFRRDVRPFLDNGAFHKEHQKGECDPDGGEDQECVEISERGSLLFAQVFQRLPGHGLRGSGIAGLLQVPGLDLREVRIYSGVKGVEIITEPQVVKYLAPLRDRLAHRSTDAATFIAQQGQSPTAAPRIERGM